MPIDHCGVNELPIIKISELFSTILLPSLGAVVIESEVFAIAVFLV